MRHSLQMFDAQSALNFLISQRTHIEPGVYQTKYPDIQYPNLIPVDTSANEWAKTVTFYSQDMVGLADWFHAEGNDMPRADVNRSKHEAMIEMAGIGYGYNMEELAVAQLVPGTNLSNDKAMAAKRAYEEFMERIVFYGDANKNFDGLIDYTGVTAVTAPAGTGGEIDWEDKTPEEIMLDINNTLTGIYTGSNTVEMADTILLPVDRVVMLATLRIPDTSMTIMEWIAKNNMYTVTTGQPLTIRGVRGLETAGAGGTGRMVAYRRDPQVLKLHLPMPHRFLETWRTSPMRFDVPGIFRTGGVEIRRPAAVRYLDGVTTPGTL